MQFRQAQPQELYAIVDFYGHVIDRLDPEIRLGWARGVYPSAAFLEDALALEALVIMVENGAVIGAAVVDHQANSAYDTITWSMQASKEKTAVIHALAVAPERQGEGIAKDMLAAIIAMCRQRGDAVIRLDVLTRNKPAAQLYTSMGFVIIEKVFMFYDAVGEEEFWLLEHQIAL